MEWLWFFFFFFQAEDGIRDDLVTGVQTCALPIWSVGALICERAASERDLARVLPVEVPVPHDRAPPSGVRTRENAEAADHALSALVVAVQQVDGEPPPRFDRSQNAGVRVIGPIPNRTLPEADVSGRHVQVTRLATERVWICMRLIGE